MTLFLPLLVLLCLICQATVQNRYILTFKRFIKLYFMKRELKTRMRINHISANKMPCRKSSHAQNIFTSQETLRTNTFDREVRLVKKQCKLEILGQMLVENVCRLLHVYLLSIVVGLKLNRQIADRLCRIFFIRNVCLAAGCNIML